MTEYNELKLSNQLCFPLYVLSKEIISKYRVLLDKLEITYPQYLVLMVLWENDDLTVSQIGEKLFLDSGTLTPLLKRLEVKNIIERNRCIEDERVVKILLTDYGVSLKEQACEIPKAMVNKINLSDEEIEVLKNIINKLKHIN